MKSDHLQASLVPIFLYSTFLCKQVSVNSDDTQFYSTDPS